MPAARDCTNTIMFVLANAIDGGVVVLGDCVEDKVLQPESFILHRAEVLFLPGVTLLVIVRARAPVPLQPVWVIRPCHRH